MKINLSAGLTFLLTGKWVVDFLLLLMGEVKEMLVQFMSCYLRNARIRIEKFTSFGVNVVEQQHSFPHLQFALE